MISRRVLQRGSISWCVIGFIVGTAMLGTVDPDARLLFLGACIAGASAAALASVAVTRHHDRLAGLLLLISVVTPTVFAWILNVPALVAGLALVVAPRSVIDDLATGRG